eukprot:1935681-Rhodomonas_salina.2
MGVVSLGGHCHRQCRLAFAFAIAPSAVPAQPVRCYPRLRQHAAGTGFQSLRGWAEGGAGACRSDTVSESGRRDVTVNLRMVQA